MMAADYRHIDGLENRLGRHYSRFPPFSPTPALADQSLALRKLCDAGSNRRSRVKLQRGALLGGAVPSSSASADGCDNAIELTAAVAFTRRGAETKLVLPGL